VAEKCILLRIFVKKLSFLLKSVKNRSFLNLRPITLMLLSIMHLCHFLSEVRFDHVPNYLAMKQSGHKRYDHRKYVCLFRSY
jgi:hypothetical protein